MRSLRKCKFSIPKTVKDENASPGYQYKKVDDWKDGYFHEWGYDFEEFETGPGNFSVGIVEDENGIIYMPFASDVVFTQ